MRQRTARALLFLQVSPWQADIGSGRGLVEHFACPEPADIVRGHRDLSAWMSPLRPSRTPLGVWRSPRRRAPAPLCSGSATPPRRSPSSLRRRALAARASSSVNANAANGTSSRNTHNHRRTMFGSFRKCRCSCRSRFELLVDFDQNLVTDVHVEIDRDRLVGRDLHRRRASAERSDRRHATANGKRRPQNVSDSCMTSSRFQQTRRTRSRRLVTHRSARDHSWRPRCAARPDS